MKDDVRQHMSWSSRFRFLIRLLGMTAILIAGAGALYLSSAISTWNLATLMQAIKNELGASAFVGAALLFGGVLVAVFALVVEVLSSLTGGSGTRGAASINAALQVILVLGLLVGINLYAFWYETDFDLTSNKQFTLPDSVVAELQKLKSETTIIVVQQHKTFGRLSDKPDRFDYAAERKVVEKVEDLVGQFRKLGSQFKVVVLDVEEEGYDKKLDEVTKGNPSLKTAIQTAPENSLFFVSDKKVQRMSFNEFYQLDKHASNEQKNLVLYPQGIENLVKRITAIEEKRPKVAIAVTHAALTTNWNEAIGTELFTLAGLKKSLNEYGFDTVDVVLKKNYRQEFEGDPASFTFQETKFKSLEEKLEEAKSNVKTERRFTERLDRNLRKLEAAQKKELKDRIDVYNDAYFEMHRMKFALTEADRRDEIQMKRFEAFILGKFAALEKQQKQDQADAEEDLAEVEKELAATSKQERALEDIYLTDVKAKFTRLLDECDMLVIPRLTIMDAPTGGVLPRALHRLDKSQADVIKESMKAGKPVLVCAGPVNVPFDGPLPPAFDDIETMLNDRGVELAKQTVLFNIESKSFRDTQQEDELSTSSVKVPSIRFSPPDEWKLGKVKPNPIAQSLEVLVNSIDKPLDINLRAPRPITVADFVERNQGFSGPFLWTNPRSWNEKYPFNFMFRMQPNPFTMQMSRARVPMPPPRMESAADENQKMPGPPGDEERRGPFSIAVAVDSQLPEHWYTDKEKNRERRNSRLVVIGHGGIFNKPELTPATEKLLLATSNWLLGREDRMPHAADPNAPNAADRPWKYPRVEMSKGHTELWHWGTFLGLPALFIYLGLIVLMLRRVR